MAILNERIRGMPTAKNYINGEWVASKGEIIEVTNPATNQPIGRVGISTHGPHGGCTAEFQNRSQEKGRADRQDQILTLTAALAEEV